MKEAKHHKQTKELVPLIVTLIGEGMNSIAHDSFNECFESPRKEKRPLYKLPGALLSFIFSVAFRVPVRALIFFSNLLICGFLISIIGIIYPFDTAGR